MQLLLQTIKNLLSNLFHKVVYKVHECDIISLMGKSLKNKLKKLDIEGIIVDAVILTSGVFAAFALTQLFKVL